MNFRSRHSALEDGKSVLKLLKNPKGWRIDVWENLGWHVALRKHGMYLHWNNYTTTGPKKFSVLFDSDGQGPGGETYWHDYNISNTDPNKAIEKQLKVAKAFVAKCQRAIDQVER